ncbi:flagellar protein FlaG [Desulfogranum japonicum]|uniref:flagellar protein FlaG n=1 Tax=Desulfogranum japonicum TaxID=231447 RepID=UPI0003F7A728|nr:flagellar protein FlaG [Desulfogranum japonicum]
MLVEAIGSTTVSPPRVNEPLQQVERQRQETEQQPQIDSSKQNKVQSEELLNQIKALTENGLYSVRFEQDENVQELVVKIVDNETDEVIRQIPPEELLNLTKVLQDLGLRGNIVDTES